MIYIGAPVIDPFTERFYALERAARRLFEPPEPLDLTMGECRSWLDKALATGSPAYSVVLSDRRLDGGTGGACSLRGDIFLVSLPPGRRRPWTVLHEAAHVLEWGDGHGPLFASRCLGLWAQFGGWPAKRLDKLAELHGVALFEEPGYPSNETT